MISISLPVTRYVVSSRVSLVSRGLVSSTHRFMTTSPTTPTPESEFKKKRRFNPSKRNFKRDDAISSASFIAEFENPSPSNEPKYLLNNIPFPLNPYFKPESPISETSRKAIYDLFASQPDRWTPYELAKYFGIATDRVKAIIRLKALEAKMKADGKPIQTQLTKGMEKLLCPVTLKTPQLPKNAVASKDAKNAKSRSKLIVSDKENTPTNPNRMEPYRYGQLSNDRQPALLQLLDDEDDSLNWLDVSKLLMREPFANFVIKANKDAMSIFEPQGPTGSHAHQLSALEPSNPRQASKASFMFTDTSAASSYSPVVEVHSKANASENTPSQSFRKKPVLFANVTVREKDGSLRRLTHHEKWKMKNVKPLEFAQR